MPTNWQKNTSGLDILRTHGFAVPSSAQGMVQILSVLGRSFPFDAVGHDHHQRRESVETVKRRAFTLSVLRMHSPSPLKESPLEIIR